MHDGKRKVQLLFSFIFLVCPAVEKSIAGDELVPMKEKCPRLILIKKAQKRVKENSMHNAFPC